MLRREQSSKDLKLIVFQAEGTAGTETPSQETFWNVPGTEGAGGRVMGEVRERLGRESPFIDPQCKFLA